MELFAPNGAGFADAAQINELRQRRRFRIRLPVEITQLGGKRVSRPGLTFDISSGGVYFSSNRDFQVGRRIEYLVTLSRAANICVQIRCFGHVVRIVQINDPCDFTCRIAVSVDRYQFVRSDESASTKVP